MRAGAARRSVRVLLLPYGCWTRPDGGEVLFNRRYEPIWQRAPGQRPAQADRRERVTERKRTWFYNDRTPEAESRHAAESVLREWGVPLPTIADLAGERAR